MNGLRRYHDDDSFVRDAERFGKIHGATLPDAFARNLTTGVELWRDDGLVMPVTINHCEPGNTWVCSPLTAYCHYAVEEVHRNLHPLWATPLSLLCKTYGYGLERARIDQAVAVNNWLLSTNLYPVLHERALSRLIATSVRRWPRHAIWFRSLNAMQNGDWLRSLQDLGFELIPSRQVYLFDDLPSAMHQHANLRRDMRLLRETPLQRIGQAAFRPADYAHIARLYAQLYLDKYSRLNPQYTPQFMQRWHEAGLLRFMGFRDADGVLQAVVGMFRQGDSITAPIVGYNTALPRSLGLYRLLMASVFDEAMATGATVNLSAGAAHFKRLRGGKPVIEYSAVLTKHLPAHMRHAITLLRALATAIGVPIMKRFEL